MNYVFSLSNGVDTCLYNLVLVLLSLNVPVNNFSVMSGRSHRLLGITSTFRRVNVSLLKDITRRR